MFPDSSHYKKYNGSCYHYYCHHYFHQYTQIYMYVHTRERDSRPGFDGVKIKLLLCI